MNILFVATFPMIPYEGGVQRVTDTLSKELLSRGHNVNYLCFARKHKLNYPNFLCNQFYVELNKRSDEEIQGDLENITNQYGITHVINQTCNDGSNRIIKNLPANLRGKVIYTYHIIPFSYKSIKRKQIIDSPAHNYRQVLFKIASVICPSVYKSFFYRVEKKSLSEGMQLATKFCFISDKFYKDVLEILPNAPKEKFVAINNPNTFGIQDHLPKYEEREKEIVWVGRVQNGQKNVLGFLKMWDFFSKSNPDWKANVVGNGDDLDYFKSYVKKHNILNVNFVGGQKDIMSYYKKSRFIAVTSFGESWGMVLTEAMACGCIPTAMNTFATLNDIIDDGHNGLICEPNEQEMAERIICLSKNNSLCSQLSKSAIEKVKKFDSIIIVNQWEALLESL